MPGLQDLPSELLEQINDIYEGITPWEDRAHLGYLRLTCRYIEQSIRRSFRLHRFYREVIRSPADKYIQRFCAVTQVPDLATSLGVFTMHCADDGTTEQRARLQTHQDNKGHPTTSRSDLAISSDIDRLVPAALTRHKAALLAAFIAAESIDALDFTDYHYFLPQGLQGPQDHENQRVTCDDFPPRRRSSPVGILQNDYACDISSTFNFTLSLAAQAGLSLKHIAIYPLVDTKIMTGLTNAVGLVAWKSALLRVETLELAFVNDRRDGVRSADEAGILIGQQLYECIGNFPVLTKLSLDFNRSASSLAAWLIFARGRAFPALQDLRLSNCKIDIGDLSDFVLKHHRTLNRLVLYWLDLEDGVVQDIRDFLRRLRERATVEHFTVVSLELEDYTVLFPAASLSIDRDMPDEEEYVWVDVNDWVGLHGMREVQEGLALMEECIKMV